ncbi:3-oxoacyl-[acyl-carrier-protein] synthase [Tulasnella sp. 427]|nr:3-oxoacyl-[acyl-carrier-protein] synthase [Tulasnella sp. 427]
MTKAGSPASVVIKGSARSCGPHQANFEAVRVPDGAPTKRITVAISKERIGSSIPLELGLLYHRNMGFAPIHEVAESRDTASRGSSGSSGSVIRRPLPRPISATRSLDPTFRLERRTYSTSAPWSTIMESRSRVSRPTRNTNELRYCHQLAGYQEAVFPSDVHGDLTQFTSRTASRWLRNVDLHRALRRPLSPTLRKTSSWATRSIDRFIATLHHDFLRIQQTEIYNLTATFDADICKNRSGTRIPSSALFAVAAKGDAEVFAIFGGQGTNEVYVDELQGLYDIYKPYIADLTSKVINKVLVPLAQQTDLAGQSYYAHDSDVASWLDGSVERPPLDYFVSVLLSLPLISLTRLVHYLVTLCVANVTPGEFCSRLNGTTGHSQGLTSAVAITASDSFDSLTANILKAIK